MSEFRIGEDPQTKKKSVYFVSNIYIFFPLLVVFIGLLAAMAIPKMMKAMDEIKRQRVEIIIKDIIKKITGNTMGPIKPPARPARPVRKPARIQTQSDLAAFFNAIARVPSVRMAAAEALCSKRKISAFLSSSGSLPSNRPTTRSIPS